MIKLNEESSELSHAAKKHQDGRGPSRIPESKPIDKGNYSRTPVPTPGKKRSPSHMSGD
jgi:hypothetical protein